MKNIYSLMIKLPLIGRVIQAANAYASDGSISSNKNFVPLRMYSKIFISAIPSILITLIITTLFPDKISDFKVGDFIKSSYPSILGFAIGVYALFFVIPRALVELIEKNRKKLKFGPEIIPSEMFYPLVVLTFTLILSFLLTPVEDSIFVLVIEIFLAIYGFTLIFDLLATIYLSSLTIIALYRNQKPKRLPFKQRLKNKKEADKQ